MYYLYYIDNKIVLMSRKNTELIPIAETPFLIDARNKAKKMAIKFSAPLEDLTKCWRKAL